MPDTFDPDDIATLLHQLADASGEVAMRYFRTRPDVDDKDAADGFDPVTQGDRGAEDAILSILARQRPDDAIFGEERGEQPGSSGYRWVIDPIDGTRAFISGLPTWGTIIGLEYNDAPVAGLFNQPFTRERYWATGGNALQRGAALAPEAMSTRKTKSLASATLMTTSPRYFEGAEKTAYDTVERTAQLTRYGMDGYAYCMLAAGHIDVVMESGLQAYDICGLVPIMEAAGGKVTSWSGGEAHRGGTVLATATPDLHAEALALIASV